MASVVTCVWRTLRPEGAYRGQGLGWVAQGCRVQPLDRLFACGKRRTAMGVALGAAPIGLLGPVRYRPGGCSSTSPTGNGRVAKAGAKWQVALPWTHGHGRAIVPFGRTQHGPTLRSVCPASRQVWCSVCAADVRAKRTARGESPTQPHAAGRLLTPYRGTGVAGQAACNYKETLLAARCTAPL